MNDFASQVLTRQEYQSRFLNMSVSISYMTIHVIV